MPIVLADSKFFTVEEVGEIFGLHPVTIRNMMRLKRIPARKFGGRWYISEANLQQALDARPVKDSQDPDQDTGQDSAQD